MRFVYVLCLMMLTGCATGSQPVSIIREDGINRLEVVEIAKTKAKDSGAAKDYRLSRPDVLRDIMVRDYPEYWFVTFPPKEFNRSFWSYLVVVNRTTGDVVFSDEFVPLKIVDYDWVFDASIPRRF